ncbi:ketopantoate reductase family protein [Heliobacterium chlorum]|uniref:2-dehydropantoate 2-reductase n=1 Tax=Heliobacterium chlorum TaxID=2698 RepID=A0ABR7T158_HELCL|nr:ketopantoate reductase family protein [Heliobacterium chlorum]MBC9783927.1 ketopantoate reductase family protein [Heliobacterium chlorum]
MRFAVLGAGAMGCLYGGFLAQAGVDVSLVNRWEDHVQALNERGLFIDSDDGSQVIPVQATTRPEEVGPVDVILFMVKSTDTASAALRAAPLVKRETCFLTLQNGLGNHEVLADRWGSERILAGTTSFGVSLAGPGRIRLAGRGHTLFGELDGPVTPRLLSLVEIFTKAGLAPEVSENVLGLIWDKLLINVGINALTAIADVPNGTLLEVPALTSLLEAAVQEAEAVAQAAQIAISPQAVDRTKAVAMTTGNNISSMRQDIRRGRVTEIDVMNGAIVRLGQRYNIPTPVNETLTRLVEALTVIQKARQTFR